MTTPKTCGTCSETKSDLDFHKDANAPDGLNYSCKVCRSAVTARYKLAHPDRVRVAAKKRYVIHRREEVARSSAYNKANRGRVAAGRRARFFGVSVEDYNAMSAAQNHLCAICQKPEDSVHASGTRKTLAIDHDHETGAIRELLCGRCNKALGGLGDSVELVKRALAYLEKHQTAYIDGTAIIPDIRKSRTAPANWSVAP